MRYWWVNQNQTYAQETRGGYLWSPKRKSDGGRNPFYEFMREVAPGDLILSFADTYIRAVGIAQSWCYECPKPAEFGTTGAYWDQIGWKVDVYYHTLRHQIRPVEHMSQLRAFLPERYSPLQARGYGNQGVYLTELTLPLMNALANLIGEEVRLLMHGERASEALAANHSRHAVGLVEWEEHLKQNLLSDETLQETEKQALVMARRGQGRFKENVRDIERHGCRITKVDRLEHLRASHIKPWRDSSNSERLDGENGLLLTPTVDHLFDRGFISFEDNGRLLISPVAHRPSLEKMGIDPDAKINVGHFSEGQRRHLDFHRNSVFLQAGNR